MPYNMISVRPLTPPISPGIMREREANRRQEVNPLYENRQKARSALLTLLPLLIAGNTSRALALLEYVFLEGEAQTAWTYPVPLAVLEDPQDVLRLINRDHLLDAHYPDQALEMYELVDVTAPTIKGACKLRVVASKALTRMVEDARAEGIELYVGSAY